MGSPTPKTHCSGDRRRPRSVAAVGGRFGAVTVQGCNSQRSPPPQPPAPPLPTRERAPFPSHPREYCKTQYLEDEEDCIGEDCQGCYSLSLGDRSGAGGGGREHLYSRDRNFIASALHYHVGGIPVSERTN